jgi:TrmH family RNA methyltransferase
VNALAFNNPRVQQLRRLLGRRSARHEDRLFVVEGPVLVAEAVAAGWTCLAQFVAGEADGVDEPAIDGAGPVHRLAPGVFERVASTDSPQNPMAIVEMPAPAVTGAALAGADLVVVLDRVRDPGNLGTILRSAEAAGVDAVVLTSGSVDPYNPKVVRASAGALFHVPVVDADLDAVAAAGLELIGTTSHDAPGRTVEDYTRIDFGGRVAIVLGNEASGLPGAWTDSSGPVRRWTTIPHVGRSESLNVAMAATVLVFEAARQRRAAQSSPSKAGG